MDRKSFGRRMQKYRELLGCSQESLAEKINCSPVFISYMERGIKNPSVDTLIKLANTLDISVDILLGSESPTYTSARLDHLKKDLRTLPAHQQEKILDIFEYILSREINR